MDTNTSTPNPLLTTPALELVAAELRRVQLLLGYSPARDDQYTKGELTDAAVAYLVASQVREQLKIAFEPGAPSAETVAKVCHWPWPVDTFKPAADDSTEGRIRELVKGVGLAVSEISRLQRAEGHTTELGAEALVTRQLLSGAMTMLGLSTLTELHELRVAIPLVAETDPDAARSCIPLVDAAIDAMERGFRPDLTRTQEARALALVSLKGTTP